MSNYRPASIDDMAEIRRSIKSLRKMILEETRPTGGQVYDALDKIKEFDGDYQEIRTLAQEAQTAAVEAQEAAEAAEKSVNSVFPVSGVLLLTADITPSGMPGTWSRIGSAQIGSYTYYLWERVS